MRAWRILAAVLVCAVFHVMVRADGPSVPFELRDRSTIVIPVTVDGRGPFRFLLDTGSTRSAVTDRLAAHLALSVAGHTVVLSPGGTSVRRVAEAVFELGRARSAVAAMVLPARDLGPNIDGMIGADVLVACPFTIDYIERRLSFDRHDDTGAATLPLSYGTDGFLVTLPAPGGRRGWRLIPDSGASAFVLIDRGHLSARGRPLAAVPVRGIAGVAVGRAVLFDRLPIGDIQLRDQLGVVVSGSAVDERFADGLLPLQVFARVSFDITGKTLTLVPRE